jgi:hypothetical protein
MRECQQCGEANQVSSRFCVVCGTPIAAAGKNGPLPPPPIASASALPPPPSPLAAGAAYAAPIVVAAPPAPPPPAPPPVVSPQGLAAPGGTGRPSPPLANSGARDLSADFPLDGPRTLVGFLVSYETVEIGQYWPIHQGRNVLGRQGAATGLDIEITHPTTSSVHAVLLAAARPGRVAVEDTSSTNGTFVNDNILAPGQRWELRDGDRVRFGLFDTVIKIVGKT